MAIGGPPEVLFAQAISATFSGGTNPYRLDIVNVNDLILGFLYHSVEGENDTSIETVVRSPVPPWIRLEKFVWMARSDANKDSAGFGPADLVIHGDNPYGTPFSGAAQGFVAGFVVIGGTGISQDPIDALDAYIVEDLEPAASVTLTWPDITTTVDDCLVVYCAMFNTIADAAGTTVGSWSNANLTDLGTLDDIFVSTGDRCLVLGAGVMETAGAVGVTTATISQTARASYAIMVIKPAEVPSIDDPISGVGWTVGRVPVK